MPPQDAKLHRLKAIDKINNATLPDSGFRADQCQPYFFCAEHVRQLGGSSPLRRHCIPHLFYFLAASLENPFSGQDEQGVFT